MKKTFAIFSIVLLASASACSHGSKVDLKHSQVSAGAIRVTADWIKDKGKKFDVQITVANVSPKPVIFFLGAMTCSHGGVSGQLKHTFFNTGERTVDFQVGESKTFRMVCNLQENAKGGYKIGIAKVYDNPSGDGKTTGSVVGSDVVLEIGEP